MAVAVDDARTAMRSWAKAHGECDTQGITNDEWQALAQTAVLALHHDSRLTHAVCTGCYADLEPGREPYRIADEHRTRERCCSCGRFTRSGIFYRAMPRELAQCMFSEDGDGPVTD